MKLSKLTSSLAAAALAASAAFAPVNAAEFGGVDVSASAGVANMYLWRGFDLGYGDAAVSGDITVSAAGFYGTVWGSSGDATAGTEYDLILGYGGAVGDFSYDVAVISYVYPTDVSETDIGDFMEAILTVGYGPVSFSYYDNIEAKDDTYGDGLQDYSYFTAGATFGAFGLLIGRHDFETGDDPTHLDLSYAYNDRLSFTVSKMVADEDEVESDAHFVVSYTLPLE